MLSMCLMKQNSGDNSEVVRLQTLAAAQNYEEAHMLLGVLCLRKGNLSQHGVDGAGQALRLFKMAAHQGLRKAL